MGKKKRSSRPKRPPEPKKGPSPVVGGVIGALLGAGLMFALRPAPHDHGPPASRSSAERPGGEESGSEAPQSGALGEGEDVSDLQRRGAMMLQQQIQGQLAAMNQDPGRIDAEDPDRQLVFAHPDHDLWLVVQGRARPDERDRWTATVLRSGKDPLTGDLPEEGLAIEGVFELGGAKGIEDGAFNETGSVAMVLTRTDSRGRGPGDLFRLVPGELHARKIDDNVFRFSLGPSGDAVVYERAVKPEEPLGERELKIFHSSRQETTLIRSFAFPREQLGDLGPWGPGGVYLELSVETYTDGFRPESVARYTLDPFNPTNFTPVNAGE